MATQHAALAVPHGGPSRPAHSDGLHTPTYLFAAQVAGAVAGTLSSVIEQWRIFDGLFVCDALFNTYCFILVFLPLVLGAYWVIPSRRWKLTILTAASFVFYGLWDYRFIPLLFASSIFDFWAGQRLEHARESGGNPKRWLIGSVVFNLSLLGVFKYGVFFMENARSVMDVLGIPVEIPYIHIILPIGISFYTFQTLSYTIDIYRGQVRATRSFLKYLCYVTMFPQLVAGPIVRYKTMDEQLDAIPRRLPIELVSLGVTMFVLGLAKKVLVADPIGNFVNPYYADVGSLDALQAWAVALGYVVQLYFDFSGYSDMAMGLGAFLGLRYPINFRAPYQALNPADLWRRWHISLTTFIRDYLYVPLGGNRVTPRRLYVNTVLVMFIAGWWHGAYWSTILWGVSQGLIIVAYNIYKDRWDAQPVFVQRIATLWCWVVFVPLFKIDALSDALTMIGAMFDPRGLDFTFLLEPGLLFMLAAFAFTLFVRTTTADLRLKATPRMAAGLATLFVACLLFIGAVRSPFLYYQF